MGNVHTPNQPDGTRASGSSMSHGSFFYFLFFVLDVRSSYSKYAAGLPQAVICQTNYPDPLTIQHVGLLSASQHGMICSSRRETASSFSCLSMLCALLLFGSFLHRVFLLLPPPGPVQVSRDAWVCECE